MNEVNAAAFRGVEAETGHVLDPEYAISSEEDVSRACAAAHSAFHAYRALPPEKRAQFLDAIGDEIMGLGDALIERGMRETGLPEARLIGERGRTVGQLKLFAEVVRAGYFHGVRIDTALPEREPLPRPDLRMRKIPVGPVAVFGASNFPLAFSTAGGDTASALAAGCPVVVKGHPAHPGVDAMVAGAIRSAAEKTGMPEGVFGHVVGPDIALGKSVVENEHIAAVGFTGSRAAGLALTQLAQARPVPIPVYAEMASVNPVILMPARLSENAEGLGADFVGSLTMGAGQFCTNPGLVLAVEGSDLDTFVAAARGAVEASAAQTMLTGAISKSYAQGKARLADHPHAKLAASGREGSNDNAGSSAIFTVSGDAFLKDQSLAEEVFGAASVIVSCSDMDELTRCLEALEGQLTTTIHMAGGDDDGVRALLPTIEVLCGRILFNGWPTGVEVAHAMVHGGPFPSTSDGRTTSVGTLAIERFLRPVCYQNMPADLMPHEVRDEADVPQFIDGAAR